MQDFILTSESVTVGHPDKLCDQISDAVVDAALGNGVPVPLHAECALANGIVFLSVHHGQAASLDLIETTRRVITDAGYVEGAFTAKRCTVLTNTSVVAVESGWTASDAMTASRAVTAFGFACSHTPEFMPYPVWCAHRITRALDAARRGDALAYLMADGQAQVAVRFKDRLPIGIDSMVLTTALNQDAPSDDDDLRDDLMRHVVSAAFDNAPVMPGNSTRVVVRRAEPSPAGGPAYHAGLTGRKIADDGYGGYARQTATALSGKDPSRIDRIAAYAARHVAKCVVAAELADECEVQLSYSIGDSAPVSFEIDTFGSGKDPDSSLSGRLADVFDLRVGAIVERFGLWNLVRMRGGRFYRDLAVYGHFGRNDLEAPWENTGMAAEI